MIIYPPLKGTYPVATLNVTAPSGGDFNVAHGLAGAPSRIRILVTSPGEIWAQKPIAFDATNLYLTSSNAGLTAIVTIYQ